MNSLNLMANKFFESNIRKFQHWFWICEIEGAIALIPQNLVRMLTAWDVLSVNVNFDIMKDGLNSECLNCIYYFSSCGYYRYIKVKTLP